MRIGAHCSEVFSEGQLHTDLPATAEAALRLVDTVDLDAPLEERVVDLVGAVVEHVEDLEGELEPSGGYDYLRTLAISRLALDNITHVQGSWVTQGMKICQLSLAFGADDLGSIMLEENVVAAAGTSHRMALDDMERIIRGAGYEPRQRRTLYEPL